MWRDALLLDQPVQHRSCPVSGITHKPLRLEAKALICSLDHGLSRADLGLANGAGRLDIDDDAALRIDQIIVGVSEQCWSLVSAGPLRRGIGRRDELRDDVAGRTPRRFSRVARYSSRRDPCGNPDLRSSAAYWRRLGSGLLKWTRYMRKLLVNWRGTNSGSPYLPDKIGDEPWINTFFKILTDRLRKMGDAGSQTRKPRRTTAKQWRVRASSMKQCASVSGNLPLRAIFPTPRSSLF
jgi:hypothetical protein